MFFAPLFTIIPAAATGAAEIIIGISLLETMVNLDFEPFELAPVLVMVLVTAFMGDFVAGIALGLYVYLMINTLRAICERRRDSLPGLPIWILGALMVLYFIF